jgi:RNA polymerase sigma-70 factor, ECF subfamily
LSPASDDEILGGCLRGEKPAWETFVERYSKLVWWSAWKALEGRRSGDKQDLCREVFQEFFRRAMEPAALEKFRQARHLPKYLQATAMHLTYELLRRAGVRDRSGIPLDLAPEAEQAAGREEDPREQASSAERRAVLASVLNALSPKERACLEMHYLDGNTHKEIGEILGLPQDTVSTILRRTKDKVREELRKKGIEE